MIDQCFRHIYGIGSKTEEILKGMGFHSWEQCLAGIESIPFGENKKRFFLQEITRSLDALGRDDIGYFTSSFPTAEQWRILGKYFHRATFIDIETTGLNWYDCHASVIAAYHRGEMLSFVYGENLDDFLFMVDDSELLVTFNGNCFDIPFLEKTFNVPSLRCPHIDLRWIAYHCGYRGSLKSIEVQMNIIRPEHIRDIDGYEAVHLFYLWQYGDTSALQKLVAYCKTDVLATYLVAERLLNYHGIAISETDPDNLFKKAVA